MFRTRSTLKPPLLIDPAIVATTIILVSFSILMVYSTTGVVAQEKYGDAFYFARRQLMGAIVGLVLMFVCSHLRLERLKRWSPQIFILCVVALVLTLIPGIGDNAGGARRWIKLAFFRFQPAEFVKLGFVIFMAGFFERHEAQLKTFNQGIVKPFLLVGLVAGMLLLQPDFGSAAIIALVTLAMAAASGVRLGYIVACGLSMAVCAGGLVVMSPYRMNRLLAFTAPWADASGKGYQLIQSLIAVGTGQWGGVGLGASQQKLFFLPAAHTDFIFAVIAEELGFLGAVAVLLFFIVFLWRGLALAQRFAEDPFSFSLAVGLTLLVVLPALLNVGVVTGLLPTKGLVLPLVGYGSSSLIACLAGIGLLLSLARSFHRELL